MFVRIIKKFLPKLIFSAIGLLVLFALIPAKNADAALCPVGGSQTLAASCEMPAIANYTDLTIPAGVIVTAPVGQKINIIATGTVTIASGGGINVIGKGNNAAGKGVDGSGSSSAGDCIGVYAGGGGGGGYGGAGGAGGADVNSNNGSGGLIYGSSTSPSDLGSPGGIGGVNTVGAGLGGGAIKINAANIILNGFLRANGEIGSDPLARDGSGGGGGGSGGSIWLIASSSFDFTGGVIEANGGDGGPDVNCGGSDGGGGGGGGGRISLEYKGPKIGAGTTSIAAGVGGIWNASNGSNGTLYENPCYLKVCDSYCGGANNMTGYNGGTCDAVTGNCVFASTQNCVDADGCTLDTCDAGVCGNTNVCGGIVPCGRLVKGNDPSIDMTKPCDLCAAMYMLKRMLNFIMELATGIAVFIIVLGGLLYAFSAGNPGKIEKAKSTVTGAIIGLAIMFAAWLIVAIILNAMGYADITNWNQVNCALQT